MKNFLIYFLIFFYMESILAQESEDLVRRWNEWKTEYNKVYPTPEEEAIKFDNWKKTDERLHKLNSDPIYKSSTEEPKFTHSSRSDYSKEEWHRITQDGDVFDTQSEWYQRALNNKGPRLKIIEL